MVPGTFRPRTEEADWCRHMFRERNKAADTHADWLIDQGDTDLWCCPLMEPDAGVARVLRRGLWVRDETGAFEKVGHGGRVLRDTAAMKGGIALGHRKADCSASAA